MVEQRLKELVEEIERLRKSGEDTTEYQILIYELMELIDRRTTEERRRLMALGKELDIIESHNQSQIYEIKVIESKIEKLKPILDDRAHVLTRLNEETKRNREKIDETSAELKKVQSAIEETQRRNHELDEQIRELEERMEEDKSIAEQKYKFALDKMKNITSHYPLMHYLLSTTLENIPEAELMVVIGTNQPVPVDKIKKLCRSVPPVQVSRHLQKLMTDGYVEQDREENWKVSDNFLAKIERDPFEKFEYVSR